LPDLAIARVVVVRIELARVEGLAARRAAIVVLAAAVHRHDLADEGRGRVETAPAPLSARGAALEAAWPSFRPGPGQAAVQADPPGHVPSIGGDAKLIDVYPPSAWYPQGYALNLTDSIARLRYLNNREQGEPVKAGEPVEATRSPAGPCRVRRPRRVSRLLLKRRRGPDHTQCVRGG
jgi:hypothetical protein